MQFRENLRPDVLGIGLLLYEVFNGPCYGSRISVDYATNILIQEYFSPACASC